MRMVGCCSENSVPSFFFFFCVDVGFAFVSSLCFEQFGQRSARRLFLLLIFILFVCAFVWLFSWFGKQAHQKRIKEKHLKDVIQVRRGLCIKRRFG